jgi:hypothetical protein
MDRAERFGYFDFISMTNEPVRVYPGEGRLVEIHYENECIKLDSNYHIRDPQYAVRASRQNLIPFRNPPGQPRPAPPALPRPEIPMPILPLRDLNPQPSEFAEDPGMNTMFQDGNEGSSDFMDMVDLEEEWDD